MHANLVSLDQCARIKVFKPLSSSSDNQKVPYARLVRHNQSMLGVLATNCLKPWSMYPYSLPWLWTCGVRVCVCACNFYLVIYFIFEWIAQLKLVGHILLLFGTMQLQYNVPIFLHGYWLLPRSSNLNKLFYYNWSHFISWWGFKNLIPLGFKWLFTLSLISFCFLCVFTMYPQLVPLALVWGQKWGPTNLRI